MLVIDEVRGPLHDCKNELLMYSSGIVSDSMCPPQSLGFFLRKHASRRKKAQNSIPSVMHDHVASWPIREESARFSSLRRRRKLRLRSNHLFAAMGSQPGSTSRRCRGQSSHHTRGQQRGCSVTTGLTAQAIITSKSGYDTGVSSPEGRVLCYEAPQACSPLDLAQVHDTVQGSWFIIFIYTLCLFVSVFVIYIYLHGSGLKASFEYRHFTREVIRYWVLFGVIVLFLDCLDLSGIEGLGA
ncbi:hypothetical protein LOK49_LG03G00616 [Camellia lanceoleosa]|uniref:Uncharacterized protein n=1 Tax=Camellia lanceoleosa TaxID=1840588 RepID=A0ACC0IFY1_9ERIC|nr:hypothetical protein LOK49_LG03G00616 [Camellia lanceoleosa]